MYVKKLPEAKERTSQKDRGNHTWSHTLALWCEEAQANLSEDKRPWEERPAKSQHHPPDMWQVILNQTASVKSPDDYSLMNDPRGDQKNHPAELSQAQPKLMTLRTMNK